MDGRLPRQTVQVSAPAQVRPWARYLACLRLPTSVGWRRQPPSYRGVNETIHKGCSEPWPGPCKRPACHHHVNKT